MLTEITPTRISSTLLDRDALLAVSLDDASARAALEPPPPRRIINALLK